ncbi:hypothetical protein [Streptomyces carpaticus]|uniref:Uncharacterized protein n=1 Tax=Streptomyces carpaticus TaxID=285558 RepID=A0ABV4ZMZ9_9ACTN
MLRFAEATHPGDTRLASLVEPNVAGLSRYRDTLLHMSRGTGFWGSPVRLDADPDIPAVELVSPRA